MDPKANLKEQLSLAREIIRVHDLPEEETVSAEAALDLARDLAEHVLALDEWMRRGGFSPYA